MKKSQSIFIGKGWPLILFFSLFLITGRASVPGKKELLARGDYFYKLKLADSCKKVAFSLKEKAEKEGDKEGLANALLLLSKTYTIQNSFFKQYLDTALLFADKAINGLNRNQSPELVFTISLHKSTILTRQLKFYESMALLEELGTQPELGNYPEIQVQQLLQTGSIYDTEKDFARALEFKNEALSLALTKAPSLSGLCYLKIGKTFSKQGDYKEAESYFQKALAQFIQQNDLPNQIVVLHDIGQIYEEEQDLLKDLSFLNQALILSRKNNYYHGEIVSLLQIGEIGAKAKLDADSIMPLLNRAYELSSQHKDTLRLMETYFLKGYFLFKKNDLTGSEIYLLKADETGRNRKGYFWLMNINKFLSEVYTKQQKPDLALKYYKNYFAYRDSLHDEEQEQSMFQAENIHQLYKLKKEKELVELTLDKEKQTRWLWITLSTGLLIITCILFFFYRFQKKRNRILTEKAIQLARSSRKLQQSIKTEYTLSPVIEFTQVNPLHENKGVPDEQIEEKQEEHPPLEIAAPQEEIEADKLKEAEPISSPPMGEEIYTELDLKVNDFIVQKLYLDAACSLSEMARQLKTNTLYLSRFINERKQTSFNDFINELRVNEFINQLSENPEQVQKYTLEHLYAGVGFSSKTTFIRAFKKVTGLTPSQFTKNLPEGKMPNTINQEEL